MPICSSPVVTRPRAGRFLPEALIAVASAGAAVALLVPLSTTALSLADEAAQLDLAEQAAVRTTTEALRAPCGAPTAGAWALADRHHTTWTMRDGRPRIVVGQDEWQGVGIGRHVTHRSEVIAGAWCD